jgi:sec-independent protein translocase protein TatB
MHFGDYTFIFLLALVLFGPKKLPEIGRQIGRLMMEFRRASNEFKMQMDEELRQMDEEDRKKRLEASLKEQTDRVLAVAPQTEPLPADPSEIVQPLQPAAMHEDPEFPGEPYVAALPPSEDGTLAAAEAEPLETHSIHEVIHHPAPAEAAPHPVAEAATPEAPHPPSQPESGEAIRHV